jgi:hypothetical protein
VLKPSARRDPRITHRVSLHLESGAGPQSIERAIEPAIENDQQLGRWLKLAYEHAL